ncbi:MAG: RuBisCO large subunit C-terminal-like domain-containing protein [Candidatus Hydrothermarchaeaceae archaeon]
MDEIIARYYVEAGDLKRAANRIAGEQSTGSWTEVKHETAKIHRKYGATVKSIEREKKIVEISFPPEDISLEIGGIPNILSVVAGNLFGLREIESVRLLDVQFPEGIVKFFKGPKYGIDGIRKIIGTEKGRRPHVGTIVKPKIGLSPKKFAGVCYSAAAGGLDFIKDDETLVNQDFCLLEDRVSHSMAALDKAREETGKKCLYAVNVTSEDVASTAQLAIDNGANCLMIDVLTSGFPALSVLSRGFNVPIHVHRTMHAAITRNKRHGISMLVFAKLIRMAGGDQLHVGCARGKMEKGSQILANYTALREQWFGLKTVFPVCSGGIHPGLIEDNLKTLGTDIVIQAGAGVHGHPDGTTAGAKAMMQAVDAFMKGIPGREYVGEHRELRRALEAWGY